MHRHQGVQLSDFTDHFLFLFFGAISLLLLSGLRSIAFAQPSPAPTPRAPQFPELPQERVRPDRTAVSVRIVRKDGTVTELDWRGIAHPFHGGKDGVAVFIDIGKKIPSDMQLPRSEMLNRQTGRLSLLTHVPNINFLGAKDSYLVAVEPRDPWIKTDPICKKAGLSFHMERGSITPLYLRFECKPIDDSAGLFEITLTYPRNLSQFTQTDPITGKSSTSATANQGSGPLQSKWVVRVPQIKALNDRIVISKFALSEARLRMLPVPFEISYGDPGSRWNFDVGLGLSYLDYREPNPLSRLSITQLGLTGKFSGSYALVRDKWILAGNMFSTLYPYTLERSPDDIPPSYYAGANLRVGYVLPPSVRLFGARISFFAGWYVWATLGQTAYGVESLSGPQFFGVLRFPSAKNLNHFGYVKVSPIATSLSQLRASNHEWAVGGGFGFHWWKRPMICTLDVARIQATDAETASEFSLTSATLGLAVPF